MCWSTTVSLLVIAQLFLVSRATNPVTIVAADSTTDTNGYIEGVSVVTVEGGRAELPCDITAPADGDSVYLVLWYRKDSGTPIYSYDSRQTTDERASDRPDLWSEPSAFGDRAHFRVSTSPAVLSVTGVQRFDAGAYTCRVDFRQSPTVYHHVTLDIIVPPQKPLIVDDRGRQVEGEVGIGPFREGDSLSLECHVPGGEPLPTVLWYLDNRLLDDTYQQTFEGTVKNGLTIRRLEREHTLSILRCLASNNNITRPVETSLTLKMLFPPQGAEIQGPLQPFTSGREYVLSCKVWGSNPAAHIEWFRGTSPNHGLRPLKALNQTVTDNGNVTISWLKYVPRPSHHHQTLICRGSNDELMTANSQTVEDYHRMEIFFPPSVKLTLGRMVNPKDLEEGDDLYFSCSINSNPPAYKLTWWHNGEEVLHNLNNGIIVSNQSLVLQKVTRAQAGSYTCEASNVEGDQVSNPVTVTIMYKPVCLEEQKTIYGVSEGETAHISCHVDSYPEADTFAWSFNTSSGGMDLSRESFTNQGSASLLSYTPKSQMDYGTVLCVAGNLVGRQIVPCIYHVIPAGPPDPPRNCTLTNQTQDSLQVECQKGFGSGLKQEFHMEVFTTHPDHQLLVNITARTPLLVARGLPPGHSLFLRLYASSSKGRSRSIRIDGYTLRMADKHPVVDGTSKEVSEKQESWSSLALVILLGIVLTLLIIGVAIGLLAKMGSTAAATQQRRQRAAAAAAAAAANRHSAQMASKMNGESVGTGSASNGDMMYHHGNGNGNADTLINQAFQPPVSQNNANNMGHLMGQQQQQQLQQQQLQQQQQQQLQQQQQQQQHDKSPDVIPHFTNVMSSPMRALDTHPLMPGVNSRTGSLVRQQEPLMTNGNMSSPVQASVPNGQIRTTADMVRMYNYGPHGMNGKDIMFRSAGHSANLYSPAATSDSSGFSEQRVDSAFSPGGGTFLPSHTFRPSGVATAGLLMEHGRLSPQMNHSYHNPTLTASPYSTLPRRPGSRGGPPPLMAATVGRNSPLLEMTSTGSYSRSSSLGRNSSLGQKLDTTSDVKRGVNVRTPLLDDDRESCV